MAIILVMRCVLCVVISSEALCGSIAGDSYSACPRQSLDHHASPAVKHDALDALTELLPYNQTYVADAGRKLIGSPPFTIAGFALRGRLVNTTPH